MGIRGVRLSILKKSPGGTIIPGGTFIRESRVVTYLICVTVDMLMPQLECAVISACFKEPGDCLLGI